MESMLIDCYKAVPSNIFVSRKVDVKKTTRQSGRKKQTPEKNKKRLKQYVFIF